MPLIAFASLLLYLVSICPNAAWAGNRDIRLETIPALDKARPFSDPVKISLRVPDDNGKSSEGDRLRIRLYAPISGRLFSTDFPHVEGTLLLDMELPFSDGSIAWEYVFPIRGEYRLEAETRDAKKEPIKKVFYLRIKESRYKFVYLGCLLIALFLLGFAAGRLFTGRREKGLVRSGVLLLIFPVFGMNLIDQFPAAESRGNEPVARLKVSPAIVGKISRIDWSLIEPNTGKPVSSRLSLAITHREKGKRIFSLQNIPMEGDFSLGFQFADASDHLLTIVAEPESKRPAQGKKIIPVTGLDPPRETFFSPMVLFLTVLALGLGTGRFSRSKRIKKASM